MEGTRGTQRSSVECRWVWEERPGSWQWSCCSGPSREAETVQGMRLWGNRLFCETAFSRVPSCFLLFCLFCSRRMNWMCFPPQWSLCLLSLPDRGVGILLLFRTFEGLLYYKSLFWMQCLRALGRWLLECLISSVFLGLFCWMVMDICLPSAQNPFLGVGEQLFSWDGKANIEIGETTWAEGWTSILYLALGKRRSQKTCSWFGRWIKMRWAPMLLMPMTSLLEDMLCCGCS